MFPAFIPLLSLLERHKPTLRQLKIIPMHHALTVDFSVKQVLTHFRNELELETFAMNHDDDVIDPNSFLGHNLDRFLEEQE